MLPRWLPLFLVLIITPLVSAQKPKEISDLTVSPELMNRKLLTISNRQLKLSDFGNKIIVLNLFADWCGPCVFNLRDLKKLQKEQRRAPIQVIGVVWKKNDPDVKTVRRFARQLKIQFPIVYDREDVSGSFAKLVNGLNAIPQTFIIDTDARIRKHFQGYNPLSGLQALRDALDGVVDKQSQKPTPTP